MKKILSIVIACIMAFSLFACGQAKEPDPSKAPKQTDENTATEWYWQADTLDLPDDMPFLTAMHVKNDRIYVGGLNESGALAYADLTGETGYFILPETYEFIYTICQYNDDIAVLAGTYPDTYYDAQNELVLNDYPSGNLEILVYSPNGELKSRIPLKEQYDEIGMNFKTMLFYEEKFFVLSYNYLIVLDSNGNELERIAAESGENFSAMCLYKDKIVLSQQQRISGNCKVCTWDVNDYHIAPVHEFSDKVIGGFGVSKDGRLLVNDTMRGSGCLSYFDLETGALDAVFKWEDIGIAGQSYKMIFSCGNGFVFYNTYLDSIHVVQEVQGTDTRTVLTLATDTTRADVYSLVNQFNAENDEYKIKVSVYDGDVKTLDMLKTEIITGTVPDIFAFYSDDSLQDVQPEGMFEDLFAYLDADPEYSRDTLLPSLIRSMTYKQKLYWLPYDFSVATMIAPSSIIPTPGITMDELEKVKQAFGITENIYPAWMTKNILLSWICRFSVGNFVDKESGVCSFEDESFIRLLEQCNMQAGEQSNINDDMEKSLFEFEMLQNLVRLSVISNLYDQNYCFAGFPNDDGNGSMFFLDLRFAIAATGAHKDGAWEFVRSILREDSQRLLSNTYFPVNVEVLEDMSQDALTNGIEFYGTTYKVTQDDMDKLWALFEDTHVLSGEDATIISIISEEAAAFFSGDVSSAEAASVIQSRASLYLAERVS